MKIIYTKEEIQVVMQKYFRNTHYGEGAEMLIEKMTLSPDQVTIEMIDPEPEEEES